LAAILSDISDGSDTDFIYILLASECQQRNNEEHFKTKKKHQTKSQTKLFNHVIITKAAGIEVFFI